MITGWKAKVIQRLVLAPLVILLALVMWLLSPLWLLAALIGSAFAPGWLRPLRVLWVVVLHLTLESIALVVLFVIWVGSGFGYFIRRPVFERWHYAIAQNYLRVFFGATRRVLRVRIETVGPAPDAYPGAPLLVLCRHAGLGDSFTLMYALMNWYHREPRIVLKEAVAWDPAIGVLLHRVPSRFITSNPPPGRDLESEVGELARNLDANDAFVIFPEGGNFTPERRERAIAKLHKLGLHRMAVRAERMTHVLAPRPGGVLAALDASPGTDVLLVAHTGLDHLITVADVWRELPMDKRILMGWWRVPREEIPEGREERIDWLFTRWEMIDAWIEEHRPVDLPRPRLRAARSPRLE